MNATRFEPSTATIARFDAARRFGTTLVLIAAATAAILFPLDPSSPSPSLRVLRYHCHVESFPNAPPHSRRSARPPPARGGHPSTPSARHFVVASLSAKPIDSEGAIGGEDVGAVVEEDRPAVEEAGATTPDASGRPPWSLHPHPHESRGRRRKRGGGGRKHKWSTHKPPGGRQGDKTFPPRSKKLLFGCATVEEVLSLAKIQQLNGTYHRAFQPSLMAACFNRLSKISRKNARELRSLIAHESDVDDLISRELPSLDQYGPMPLAIMLQSVAKISLSLGWDDRRPLWQAFERRIIDVMDGCNAQDLTNSAWAFASVYHAPPILFDALADAAVKRMSDFEPRSLSGIAWAFARSRHVHPELFRSVALASPIRASEFNCLDLVNTAWAFAKAEVYDANLFDALSAESIKRMGSFHPRALSMLAWAYASVGHDDGGTLFDRIAARTALESGEKFDAQGLATIAWSFAVFGRDGGDTKAPFASPSHFARMCSDREEEFGKEALSQLHQWQLWQEEVGSDARFSEPLRRRCYDAFVSGEAAPSQMQKNIVASLRRLSGIDDIVVEARMESGYSIDALVVVAGENADSGRRRVAVEVDGPSHYLTHRPKGSTRLKHRLIRAVDGVPLVSIPYWEWMLCSHDDVAASEKLQCQYLLERLGDHVVLNGTIRDTWDADRDDLEILNASSSPINKPESDAGEVVGIPSSVVVRATIGTNITARDRELEAMQAYINHQQKTHEERLRSERIELASAKLQLSDETSQWTARIDDLEHIVSRREHELSSIREEMSSDARKEEVLEERLAIYERERRSLRKLAWLAVRRVGGALSIRRQIRGVQSFISRRRMRR